jgi:hypothetical protein
MKKYFDEQFRAERETCDDFEKVSLSKRTKRKNCWHSLNTCRGRDDLNCHFGYQIYTGRRPNTNRTALSRLDWGDFSQGR